MSRVPAILRVRRTDYRPPSAGNPPPLERTARPGAAAWAKPPTEKESHDAVVATYSLPLLRAIAEDLGKRRAWNRKDPEQRWTMERLAACLRRISAISPA